MAINTLAFHSVLTMSVTSESASHSTLIAAYSRLDLQSDGLKMRSVDTPSA